MLDSRLKDMRAKETGGGGKKESDGGGLSVGHRRERVAC